VKIIFFLATRVILDLKAAYQPISPMARTSSNPSLVRVYLPDLNLMWKSGAPFPLMWSAGKMISH